MTQKQMWYFTFPQRTVYKDCYVCLHGTHEETRNEMFAVFGDEWAFQYASADDAGVDKFNLTKLDMTHMSYLKGK